MPAIPKYVQDLAAESKVHQVLLANHDNEIADLKQKVDQLRDDLQAHAAMLPSSNSR
jgi:hypothetical protein